MLYDLAHDGMSQVWLKQELPWQSVTAYLYEHGVRGAAEDAAHMP
jgi:hypothetical protein